MIDSTFSTGTPPWGMSPFPALVRKAGGRPIESVLIVGHQPTLGQVASLLLAGVSQDWTIRKGNVWWIAQRERGDITSTYLKAVIAPELMLK